MAISNLQATLSVGGVHLTWSGVGPFDVYRGGERRAENLSPAEFSDSVDEGYPYTYTVVDLGDNSTSAYVEFVGALATPEMGAITPTLALSIVEPNVSSYWTLRYRYRTDGGSWNEIGNVSPSAGPLSITALTGAVHEIQFRKEQSSPAVVSEWSESRFVEVGVD